MVNLDLQNRLLAHLHQVARERDPYIATAGHFFVKQYIHTSLSAWGEVEIHEFEIQGDRYQNLILNLPARSTQVRANPPILIGAHYDAVPGTPGADDNATGIAVLLELAQWFSQHPGNYPIRLVAFDLEEYGLLGSDRYAADLHQRREPLRLMLSLEMLGYYSSLPNSQRYPLGLKYFYPNQANFIGLIGNLRTLPDLIHLSHHLRRAGVPAQWLPAGNRGLLVPGSRWSDHSSFWDRGYRAIMVTDTADLRSPHYHQASDRIETLNLELLTGVCQGLANGISCL